MKNLFFCILTLGMMGSVSALAAGSDELWEVTSKMEMPGMPFPMPGQTSKVCMKKGAESDPNKSIPSDKNQDCTMSDVKVSGNKSSWTMKCNGKKPMTGTGEMTRGNGTYSGKTTMHSEGRDMMMVYAGKRVGTCQAK